MISDDARFTIHPDGRLEILNFSLVIRSSDDFDFVGGDGLTQFGNEAVLEPAIDPSRIGQTVFLAFDEATSYTYTQASFDADVARAEGFSTVLSPLSVSQAMGDVIRELYDEGTINTTFDGKLVLYGSDGDDTINHYVSRIGINVSDPGLAVPNPLHVYTTDGLAYVAGAGNDTINGTSDDDIILGGDGADQLFGGGGSDVLIFDAADGIVFGGAGHDVAYAVASEAIVLDLTASEIEVAIGGTGNDTITMGDSEDTLMAAGGDGDDLITVSYGFGQGPRVVWGGDGADVINLSFDTSSYTGQQDWRAGIMVAEVEGLTESNFADFDLSMLNVGSAFDWSQIDVLIINPDEDDQIQINSDPIRTAQGSMDFIGYTVTGYGDPPDGFGEDSAFTAGSVSFEGAEYTTSEGIMVSGRIVSRSVEFLGETYVVQSAANYWPFELHEVLWTNEGWALLLDGGEYGSEDIKAMIADQFGSEDAIWTTEIRLFASPPEEGEGSEPQPDMGGEEGEPYPRFYQYFLMINDAPPDINSVDELGTWFVVGGNFDKFELSGNHAITAIMPAATTSIHDWFLTA